MVYNKLVRDKIPEIIAADGKNCVTKTLSQDDYIKMLDRKIDEELSEFRENYDIEELADLLEVVYSIAKATGHSVDELEEIRKEKALKRGSFDEKILLVEVKDL